MPSIPVRRPEVRPDDRRRRSDPAARSGVPRPAPCCRCGICTSRFRARPDRSRPSGDSTSTWPPGRPWPSSASPDLASRSPHWRSWDCTPSTAKITGSIKLHGDELLGRNDESMSKLRGDSISMIFQDPLSALTPVYSIGDQIVETIQVHHEMSGAAALNAGDRAAGPGGHSQPGRSGEVLPARVLRRHAAAGHDRHGDRQ